MADNCSVQILEVCRVTPPPGSAAPASLPLTFFDLLWLRFPPVQRLFFYRTPAPFAAVVSNLKSSLSAALRHYLPLAGGLVWPAHHSPKPAVVSAAGDAVLLTVAESGADFNRLAGDGFRAAAEYHPLVPELAAAEDRTAVISVQITGFRDVGFCIGISSHHAILDGRSSTSFVKSWARICKISLTGGSEAVFPATETVPFYDRSIIEDPAGLEGIYVKDWLAVGGPNNRSLKFSSPIIPPDLIRGTFKLNPNDLKKLKQWVLNHREQAGQPPIHISTFTAATAYTWVCATAAEASLPDGDGKMNFGMSVDARSRLDPPLPANYFGNCVVARATAVERSELVAENGLAAAVEAISETIRSLEIEGALGGAEDWVSLITRAMDSKNDQKFLTIAGSPRFEVYEIDFGWGKPKKVEIVSIDGTGAICLAEGRDGGGGLELGWTAKRDVMQRFAARFAKGLEQL